jgi:hypothetical protein
LSLRSISIALTHGPDDIKLGLRRTNPMRMARFAVYPENLG